MAAVQSANQHRPLNLIEKIIAANAAGLSSIDDIKPSNVVVLKASWIMASEATWETMEQTFSQLNRPRVFRKDRIWVAADHTVDPRINHRPETKQRIDLVESAARELGIEDYYGPNYTIMHTEFCRERAQPGQVVIGADSHTCSAGSMSALAIGLGAADTVLPMITGETWLRIPEVVRINFVNQPPPGIGGKDVILYVLGQIKRNTAALGRAIEYVGPGLQYLSIDARFAIANMTTELGGIAGVFLADEILATYVASRENEAHRDSKLYFRPDEDAQYEQSITIDLALVDSLVAVYPSPDNVIPVDEIAGQVLDGCFIGACTTAAEDLILAALVLRQGLEAGLRPCEKGIRRVTPGSVPIVKMLEKSGMMEWYRKAGFDIGTPGCSFCVGGAADVAGPGEVWLSSQNRNFPNRMGPGSFANIASAATVAASSFSMTITDPRALLSPLDIEEYNRLRGARRDQEISVSYEEPAWVQELVSEVTSNGTTEVLLSSTSPHISGSAMIFGDNVDTDAMISAKAMNQSSNDRELGTHCFELARPSFFGEVQSGLDIVVGGHAFGCGSSREEAPRALLGAGVKAVIARSFSFIFSRNCPNLALLAIVIADDKFYAGLQEGCPLEIDVGGRRVLREDTKEAFGFQLSSIEDALVNSGGIAQAYSRAGKKVFRKLVRQPGGSKNVGGAMDW